MYYGCDTRPILTVSSAQDEHRPRILVVDDEDGIRAFLLSALTDAGFEVRTAADGLEALHDVRAWHPDVLLLDLVLPRLHGWDVARACRDLPRPPRIVLITATPAGPSAARETGADACLAKPLDVEHVLDLIWSLMQSRHVARFEPAPDALPDQQDRPTNGRAA